MLLTIGMIVKNEERYLRRCLEGITPILQQLDSELIITDTGSTDRTVEIAREFTDQIISFEWCNDFSAARNTTIQKAKGLWYMYLDADEIFTDVNSIISFFQSGEYKRYHSASYIQRNSNDQNHNIYADYPVIRMTKRLPVTKFVNSIHETLKPLPVPVKALDAIAVHYGYIQENNEEFIQKKFQRNQSLLLTQLEKEPKNPKHYLDIARNYRIVKDYEQSLAQLQTALKLAKTQDSMFLYPIFTEMAYVSYNLEHHEDTLLVIKDFFATRKKKLAFDIEMYFLSGFCNLHLKRFEEAAHAYQIYLSLLSDYQNGKLRDRETDFYEENSTNPVPQRNAVYNLIRALIELGRYQDAYDRSDQFWQDEWCCEKDNCVFFYEHRMVIMQGLCDFSGLPKLYEAIQKTEFLPDFHQYLEGLMKSPDLFQKLSAALASSDSPSDYISLCRLRQGFLCGNGFGANQITAFFSQIKLWVPYYADALYFAICYGAHVTILQEKISFYELEHLLFKSPSLHFSNVANRIVELCRRSNRPDNLSFHLWLSMLCFGALSSHDLSQEETIELFHSLSLETSHCLERMCQREILTDDSIAILPTPLRVGYYIHTALTDTDISRKITSIRLAVKLYPLLAAPSKCLVAELQKPSSQPQTITKLSLGDYSNIVKRNIHDMIRTGQTQKASEILLSYAALCPDDPELSTLRQALSAS